MEVAAACAFDIVAYMVAVFFGGEPRDSEFAITMPNLKGMNVEALMKLRNQVDERLVFAAIGLGVGIALAIIGYLLGWISS